MLRIKEEHESQLEMMEQAKDREVLETRQQCEGQVSELTSDYNEKLEEIRTELDQVRERLALEERDSKHLRDTLSEKDAIMSTLKVELEDSKEEEGRLRNRIEDLRDSSTLTEKQLIE